MLVFRLATPQGRRVEAQVELRETANPCKTCGAVGQIGPLGDGKMWECPNCHGDATILATRVGKVSLELVPQEYAPGDHLGPEEDRHLRDADTWTAEDVQRMKRTPEFMKLTPNAKTFLLWQLKQLVGGGGYSGSTHQAVRECFGSGKTASSVKNKAYHISRELKEAGILRKVCHLRWRLVKPPYDTPSQFDEIVQPEAPPEVLALLEQAAEVFAKLTEEGKLEAPQEQGKPQVVRNRIRKDGNSKLSHAAVREIRSMKNHPDRSSPGFTRGLAEKHGVTTKTVYQVWSGKRHAHVP